MRAWLVAAFSGSQSRRSVDIFAGGGRQRLPEKVGTNQLLGAFRTWRDIRLESVMRAGTDIPAALAVDPALAFAFSNGSFRSAAHFR